MYGLVEDRVEFPPALFGNDGELVMIRLSVEARHLEELLEALAGLDFPVNPELLHSPGSVAVQFPAYSAHVPAVRSMLSSCGFDAQALQVFGILQLRQ